MNSFIISSPLAISALLRVVTEGQRTTILADNLILVALAHCMLSGWTTWILALTAFIGLAFYETRIEYDDTVGNVREDDSEQIASTGKASAISSANTVQVLTVVKPAMCPINLQSLKLPQLNSSVCPASSQASDDNIRVHKISQSFGVETNNLDELNGKPMLFPCHLRHRRVAPFKDKFQHSYLYAGTPIGLHATYSPFYSIDDPPNAKRWPLGGWFTLRAQDHAIRGGAHMTLSQKLREFLVSEGADPTEWSYAYLLGTPSVNATVDNPLGFWYLYNKDRKLTAIIPELNTSYGERRMWLVRQELDRSSEVGTKRRSPYIFRGHFGKDIHVSPFMPLHGGYIIDTSDPCASDTNQLDILVTLTKPEGGPLIVTRVASSAPGLDVSIASTWAKTTFLARWALIPTTTVMTYRILSQAARIWWKAPRTWSRPEPTQTALGKPARKVEMILERSFRLLLKDLVESHPAPISVTYTTSGEHSHKAETFQSLVITRSSTTDDEKVAASGSATECPPSPTSSSDNFTPAIPPIVTLRVISPIFYSRFFHYKTPSAAFESELLGEERLRTLWSSDPTLFASILPPESPTTHDEATIYPSDRSKRHWNILSLLRKAPIANSNISQIVPYQPFRGMSSMDKWVLRHCSPDATREYRRALLRVFIGEWIGGATFGPLARFSDDLEPFGMSRDAVLRIYEALLKAGVVTVAVQNMRVLEAGCNSWNIGIAGWAGAGLNLWACFKFIC